MCFGGPDIDTSYQDFQMAEARRARQEETERQARIREGMKHIAAVFEGGTYTPSAATLDDWFDGATRPGAATYGGVQPLLDQRRAAQEQYYLPQLDTRRSEASDQLTFALSRAGLLDSTVAGDRQGKLAQDYALERGSILSKIAADIAGQKSLLNQQRSSIEAGLRASGDATQAANQALASAVTFRQDQPLLDPIGNVFYGIAEGIGAARTGQEVERIRRASRTNPLRTTSGRLVQ